MLEVCKKNAGFSHIQWTCKKVQIFWGKIRTKIRELTNQELPFFATSGFVVVVKLGGSEEEKVDWLFAGSCKIVNRTVLEEKQKQSFNNY